MLRIGHVRTFASLTLQLAVLVLLIGAFFFRFPQVSGLSMEPGIASGQFVLINTLAYRFGKPSRDDIVAFRHEGDLPQTFIKRVIALPGDRVTVADGRVAVDGTTLDEPYVAFHDTRSFRTVTVPPDSVYVLGDNRANSEDSRFFGSVPDGELIGRAIARIWPPNVIGRL